MKSSRCATCRRTYRQRPGQQCCSVACRGKLHSLRARRRRPSVACASCRKKFVSRDKSARFCSRACCVAASRRSPVAIVCAGCQVSFRAKQRNVESRVRRYCTHACACAHNGKRLKKLLSRQCGRCLESFEPKERSQRFCSLACRKVARTFNLYGRNLTVAELSALAGTAVATMIARLRGRSTGTDVDSEDLRPVSRAKKREWASRRAVKARADEIGGPR